LAYALSKEKEKRKGGQSTMKDFILASGFIGLIGGAILTVIARLNTCGNCPYAQDHYKDKEKKTDD